MVDDMFGLRFPKNTAEHAPSYYAASAKNGADYPSLDAAIEADVVVVGGGFTGVNTALELSERGYKVVLLEANRLSRLPYSFQPPGSTIVSLDKQESSPVSLDSTIFEFLLAIWIITC